ncbi:MAG: DUF2292 domain-containing protein [Negativicutes bacterium]|nr:DUF2292 domain-containing protein [Negativicutes bacterium]
MVEQRRRHQQRPQQQENSKASQIKAFLDELGLNPDFGTVTFILQAGRVVKWEVTEGGRPEDLEEE